MTVDLLENVRTGDWLDAQHFPALRWAVHGVMPEGFGIFIGGPKAGKSWCIHGIALALAGGTAALGKVATGHPRPVLYLALEDGFRRLQGRARHLLGEGVPIPSNIHYLTKVHPQDVLPTIDAWLAIHGDRAPMVIVDTLGKIMPPALPGEGAYQRDYRVGSRFKAVADEYPGVSLIVIHHTRKMGSDDWMDSTSGTNGLNGSADFTIALTRVRNETGGVLKVTGRDVPESEFAVTSDAGRWTVDGNSLEEAAAIAARLEPVEGLGDRSTEIIEYVGAQPAPVTPKDVESALGIPDARRYLARLATSGRLKRMGRGQYTSVPTIPSVPTDEAVAFEWDNGIDGTPMWDGLPDDD